MAKKSQRQAARDEAIRNEVREIFAMFRALRRSYDALADKSGITEHAIAFDGFDANKDDEHEYLRIARGMELSSRDIQAFNSHMPRLAG